MMLRVSKTPELICVTRRPIAAKLEVGLSQRQRMEMRTGQRERDGDVQELSMPIPSHALTIDMVLLVTKIGGIIHHVRI